MALKDNRSSYKTYQPANPAAWRKWLKKNHLVSPGIWLVYYKKISGKKNITYNDAVEEALCFGWIDSRPRLLDEERAMLQFSPRKPKSIWSALNKKRVEKLIAAKKMSAHGMSVIESARKNGSWDTLNASDTHTDNHTIPGDLQKAFGRNKAAFNNFQAFPPGYRRRFLFWIDSAKRDDTRKARIRQTVLMAAANKKPGVKGFKL